MKINKQSREHIIMQCCKYSKWVQNVIIMSLLHPNEAMTSFWCNNYITIMLCLHYYVMSPLLCYVSTGLIINHLRIIFLKSHFFHGSLIRMISKIRDHLCSMTAMSCWSLTHWPLGDFNTILDKYFLSQFQWLMDEVSLVKLLSDGCHWTLLMMSQHWFR